MNVPTSQREPASPLIACIGCGGRVPAEAGPTHPYMLASPGCWRTYGEWIAMRAYDPATDAVAGAHHVDCYAVQHHGNADVDRRQRQSIAVHLVSLCMLIDFDQPPGRANVTRSQASAVVLPELGLADWPHLSAPERTPAVTIAHVAAAPAGDLGSVVAQWLDASWSLWSAHHDTVRSWTRILASAT